MPQDGVKQCPNCGERNIDYRVFKCKCGHKGCCNTHQLFRWTNRGCWPSETCPVCDRVREYKVIAIII